MREVLACDRSANNVVFNGIQSLVRVRSAAANLVPLVRHQHWSCREQTGSDTAAAARTNTATTTVLLLVITMIILSVVALETKVSQVFVSEAFLLALSWSQTG